MTTEEKARAYDEAIKKAKEIKGKIVYSHLSTESCKAISEYIDTIIPELTESEDERIIKWLIKELETRYVVDGIVNNTTAGNVLAYLKKQKEFTDRELGNELDTFLHSEEFECAQKAQEGNTAIARHFAKWGAHNTLVESKHKQKPAEWSEEDDALLKEIVSFFKDGTVKLPHDLDLYAGFLQNKFKSLHPQLKQEWSEEDEKRIKQLIYDTEHIRAEYEKRKKELGESFNDELIKDCDEQISWLKSLRPHWKPSREQLEALGIAMDRNDSIGYNLRQLYEHLRQYRHG